MNGFRAKIDYLLKHNQIISKMFRSCSSLFFRFVGLFVKTDSKSVILSGHSRKYNDSTRTIYEKLIRMPQFRDFTFYWGLEDPESVEIPGEKCIKIKSDTWNYFVTALKCKYWITCVNIERSLRFKKKKTIYLNTWHGTPFKTIGNTAAGRKDFDFSYINYFCVSGDYEEELCIRGFNVKKEHMLYTGLPRNDELYHVTDAKRQEIRNSLEIPIDKKVILYAPTWRDSSDGGKTYSIKPPINIEHWRKRLGDNFVVLLRTHPYTNKLLGIQFDDFVRDYTNYPQINDLLIAADYLISDYSATMFDYSILEKPMFCYGYDYDQFKAERGFALDPQVALTSGVIKSEDDLLEAIINCDYAAESENTKRFKNTYLQFGGEATDICISKLFDIPLEEVKKY